MISHKGCINLLFVKVLAKNCIKMKEIGPRGDVRPKRPPLGSANDCALIEQYGIELIVAFFFTFAVA